MDVGGGSPSGGTTKNGDVGGTGPDTRPCAGRSPATKTLFGETESESKSCVCFGVGPTLWLCPRRAYKVRPLDPLATCANAPDLNRRPTGNTTCR